MTPSSTPILYSANGFFMGLKKGGHGPSAPRRRKYTRPAVPLRACKTERSNKQELHSEVHREPPEHCYQAELQERDYIIGELQEQLTELKAALDCNTCQHAPSGSPNGCNLHGGSNLNLSDLLKLRDDVDISRLVSKASIQLSCSLGQPEVIHDIVQKLAQELALSHREGTQKSCIGCSFLSKRLRQSEETLLRCQSDAAKEILLLRRQRNLNNDNLFEQFSPEALEPEFYDPLTHFDEETRRVLQKCVAAKIEYLVGEGHVHPNVMGLLANSPRWRRERTDDGALGRTTLQSCAPRPSREVSKRIETSPELKSANEMGTPLLTEIEVQTEEIPSVTVSLQTDDIETGRGVTDGETQTDNTRRVSNGGEQLASKSDSPVGLDDSRGGLWIHHLGEDEPVADKQQYSLGSVELDHVVEAEDSVLSCTESDGSPASQQDYAQSASHETGTSITENSVNRSLEVPTVLKNLEDPTLPCGAGEMSEDSVIEMKRHSAKSEVGPRGSVQRRLIEATGYPPDESIPVYTTDSQHPAEVRRRSSRGASEPHWDMSSDRLVGSEPSHIGRDDRQRDNQMENSALSAIVVRGIIARVVSKPSQLSIRPRRSDGLTVPDEHKAVFARTLCVMADVTRQLAAMTGTSFVADDLAGSDNAIEELQRLASLCLEYSSAIGSGQARAIYQPSAERSPQSTSSDGAPRSTSSPERFLMPPWQTREVEALKLENEQLKDLLYELTSRGSNAVSKQGASKFPASLLKSIGPSRRWREYSAREKVFLRLYADAVSRWARGEWRVEATGDLRNSEAAKFAGIRGFIDPFSDDRGSPNECTMKILSKEAEAMALYHPWRFTADEPRHPFSAREPLPRGDSTSSRMRSATVYGLKSKGRSLKCPPSTKHPQTFERMAKTHAFSSGRSHSTSFRMRPVRPPYVKLPTGDEADSALRLIASRCDGTGAKDLRDIFQHTLKSCKQHTKCFREVFVRKITDEFPVLTPMQVQALAERYKSVTYPEKVNYWDFQRDVDTLKGERPKQVWACRSSDIPEAVRILFRAAFDQRVDLRELCAEADGSPWRIAQRLNVHLSEEDAQTMMDTFGLPTAGQGFCIDPYRLHEAYKRFVWNFSHNDFRITKATEPAVQEWTPQSINVLAKSTEGVEEALTRLKHHMTAYMISPAALGDYFETNVTSAIDRMRGETATTDLFHRSLSQLLSALTQDTPLTQADVDCLTAHFAPSYRRLCAAAAGTPTPVPQVELDALDPTSVLMKASDVQLMPHCKAFDHNRSGCIRVWDLSNILARANIHAKQCEVQALAQAFGRGDGWIDYTRMCEAAERCVSDSRKWQHSG